MDKLITLFGEDTYRTKLNIIRRFWAGKGRYLISLMPTQYSYTRNFDLAKMLELAPQQLNLMAGLPGMNMPVVCTDWGTISTAKYWGGNVQFDSTASNIYIYPAAQTIDQAICLEPRLVDDPDMDAIKSIQFYRNLSSQFQTEQLWLRPPDMQGPLNTAGLVVNQEAFFTAMYDQPAKVFTFLDKVTQFLVEYANYFRSQTNFKVCGNVWPYTFYPGDLGVALTEDMMPLMSAKSYKKFGIPYLKQIQAALGGLHIHCCGAYGHHVKNLASSGLRIAALEFHYPDIKLEELEQLADQTVFVPYCMLHKQDRFSSTTQFYRFLIDSTDRKFRFWFACASNDIEFVDFVHEYGEVG